MTPAEYRAITKKGKRSKYNAKACMVDGIRFHSKGEAKRWAELKLLERAGEIMDLKRQIIFYLSAPGSAPIGQCIMDFTYWERGRYIAEDFKGIDNALSRWKRKHLIAQFPEVTIRLTGAASRRRKAAK